MMKTQSLQQNLTYQFAQYFSNKDIDGLSDLFHEDFSLFDPALEWVNGKEKVLDVLKKGFESSKVVSYKLIETFEDKDTTIARFELIMDDKKFIGVDFMKWQSQKMTELICYYNPPEK